jgi:hypothetical protein
MRMASKVEDSSTAYGMDLVCRVLFDMQQDYLFYVSRVAAGLPATVPDYSKLVGLVQSERAQSLSPLPDHWYSLATCPQPHGRANRTAAPGAAATPRAAGSAVRAVNLNVDHRLQDRFKQSGHPSITALLGGKTVDVPNHGGKPICLAWALKGQCSTNCKRAGQHVNYGRAINQQLHGILDDCGVNNPQP